jgi:hypothetical protein
MTALSKKQIDSVYDAMMKALETPWYAPAGFFRGRLDPNSNPCTEIPVPHLSIRTQMERVGLDYTLICDKSNNTPETISQGMLNIEVVVPRPATHITLDVVVAPNKTDYLGAIRDVVGSY